MNAPAAFPDVPAISAIPAPTRLALGVSSQSAVRPGLGLRLGLSVGLGGAAFLLWYAVLHTLHVFALAPPVLTRLVPIPLFGTFLGAAAGALLTGAAVAISPSRHQSSLAAALPRTLGLSIILFAVAVSVFP